MVRKDEMCHIIMIIPQVILVSHLCQQAPYQCLQTHLKAPATEPWISTLTWCHTKLKQWNLHCESQHRFRGANQTDLYSLPRLGIHLTHVHDVLNSVIFKHRPVDAEAFGALAGKDEQILSDKPDHHVNMLFKMEDLLGNNHDNHDNGKHRTGIKINLKSRQFQAAP